MTVASTQNSPHPSAPRASTRRRGGGSNRAAAWPFGRAVLSALPLLIVPLLALALWQFAVSQFDIKTYILPTPRSVVVALRHGLTDGSIAHHGWVTLQEVLIGFACGAAAGVLLAIGITRWRFVERAVYPYVVAFQTVPKVALAPIIVAWLGFGMSSKALVAGLLALFPVLVNTITGLKATDADRIDLMRSLQASHWQLTRYVRLPTALPYIFAGLQIAVVFSVIGAIVGEFVGAEAGLGYLTQASQTNLDAATTYEVIIVLSVMGLVLHALVKWAQRVIVFWQPVDGETGAVSGI